MKNKKKNTIILFLIIASIFFFLILISHGFYKTEYKNNLFVKEAVQSGDLKTVYALYITSDPVIEGRLFYGSENASITMVAYMYPGSESAKYFMKERFPQIKQEFIDTGYVRFYAKNHITEDDLTRKSERFIYAQIQSCFKQLEKDNFYDFYFELFDTNLEGIIKLVKKYGISTKAFAKCLKEQEFKEVTHDMIEVETYGIFGDPWFYIGMSGKDNTALQGVPDYPVFRRTIRNYQTILGE